MLIEQPFLTFCRLLYSFLTELSLIPSKNERQSCRKLSPYASGPRGVTTFDTNAFRQSEMEIYLRAIISTQGYAALMHS